MQIQFNDITLDIRPHPRHEWGLTTAEVAAGYGISEVTIRRHKQANPDELIEGKHWVVQKMNTPGGNQEVTFWTKRGVIRLGFFIKSDRAKQFRNWAEDFIVNAVDKLPSYQINDPVQRAQRWIEEHKQLQAVQAENESLKPIAEYAKNVLISQSEILTTLIASELHMSAIKLNRILEEKGIQRKVGKTWVLTKQYVGKGYDKLRTHVHSSTSGTMRSEHHLVWTEKGRKFIHELINPTQGDPYPVNQVGIA